jgi:hypothetical protein
MGLHVYYIFTYSGNGVRRPAPEGASNFEGMSSRGHALHFRPGTYFTVLPRLRRRASSAACELGGAFGRLGLLTLFLVCGIQPDACDSRRLLDQIAGDASSVSRHHLTCG